MNMMDRNEQYFKVYDWMVQLGISGNELNLYALIYSFTKGGDFKVIARSYIVKRLGIVESCVKSNIKSLLDKGLIEREEVMKGNIMVCQYKALISPVGGRKMTPSKNDPVKKCPHRGAENDPIGGRKMTPYNKSNNKDNNKISSTTNIAHDVEEMKKDTMWQEMICMKHKLKLQDLDELFDEFVLECNCGAIECHQNIADAKKHFHSWLRIYLKNKRNGTNTNRRNTPIDNIEQAQQQAIRESLAIIGQTANGSGEVQSIFPFDE